MALLLSVVTAVITSATSLNASTFDAALAATPLFVAFVSPNCGFCHALKPTWDEVSERLVGNVRAATVDATVEAEERVVEEEDFDSEDAPPGDVTMNDVAPSPAPECKVPAAAREPLGPVQNVNA